MVFYDNDPGTVIGEPTGNALSSLGDRVTFQLPNTRFIMGVSYRYFTSPDPSNDPQDWLYPHVLINRTRYDLTNDSDLVVGYIIEEKS